MITANITHRARILADGVNALFDAAPNKARLKLNEAVDLLAACDGHRNRHAAIAADQSEMATAPNPAATDWPTIEQQRAAIKALSDSLEKRIKKPTRTRRARRSKRTAIRSRSCRTGRST